MEKILYHPLICRDTEGTERYPMFPTTDEDTVKRSSDLYVAEIVPGYYRLCVGKATPPVTEGTFTVHCPKCGKAMLAIAKGYDMNRLTLYTCRDCI